MAVPSPFQIDVLLAEHLSLSLPTFEEDQQAMTKPR